VTNVLVVDDPLPVVICSATARRGSEMAMPLGAIAARIRELS